MWKLMFAGDVVTGYRRAQVVHNLAQLLDKDEETVAKELFSSTPVCVEQVESEEEAVKWRRDFADSGALLMMLPEGDDDYLNYRYSGANAANINVAEPTIASVFARVPALRRRNQAFIVLGMLGLSLAIVLAVVLLIGS